LFPHDAPNRRQPSGWQYVTEPDGTTKWHPTLPMRMESWSDGQQGPNKTWCLSRWSFYPQNWPLLPRPTARRWVAFFLRGYFLATLGGKYEMQKSYWPLYWNAVWSFRVWAIYHVGSFFSFSKKKKKRLVHSFVFKKKLNLRTSSCWEKIEKKKIVNKLKE
jgi:hypothetical protein